MSCILYLLLGLGIKEPIDRAGSAQIQINVRIQNIMIPVFISIPILCGYSVIQEISVLSHCTQAAVCHIYVIGSVSVHLCGDRKASSRQTVDLAS